MLRLIYSPTLTSIHNYWKNHSCDYMDFCWQSSVSIFFNTLSRFVILFLSSSKCLLISWLQSPSSDLCVCVCHFSHIQLNSRFSCVPLCDNMGYSPQAPLSMGFSRQEYWSQLPFPSGDLPDPGIKPMSLVSPALAGGFLTLVPPGKPGNDFLSPRK